MNNRLRGLILIGSILIVSGYFIFRKTVSTSIAPLAQLTRSESKSREPSSHPSSTGSEIKISPEDARDWRPAPTSGTYSITEIKPGVEGQTDRPDLIAKNRKKLFPAESFSILESPDVPASLRGGLKSSISAFREGDAAGFKEGIASLQTHSNLAANTLLTLLGQYSAVSMRGERIVLLTIAQELRELDPAVKERVDAEVNTRMGHGDWPRINPEHR